MFARLLTSVMNPIAKLVSRNNARPQPGVLRTPATPQRHPTSTVLRLTSFVSRRLKRVSLDVLSVFSRAVRGPAAGACANNVRTYTRRGQAQTAGRQTGTNWRTVFR